MHVSSSNFGLEHFVKRASASLSRTRSHCSLLVQYSCSMHAYGGIRYFDGVVCGICCYFAKVSFAIVDRISIGSCAMVLFVL